MQPLALPIQSDETIRVNGYRDGRGIRVCFQEGGFINIGLFRKAYYVIPSGEEAASGPVNIRVNVTDNDGVSMQVKINGTERTTEKILPPQVCDEIIERLLWADALLSTYRNGQRPQMNTRPRAVERPTPPIPSRSATVPITGC
jgi:hypothetical protein